MPPGDFDTFDSTVYSPQFMKRSRSTPSRLAKREQAKLARQTIFLILSAIVIAVVFFFVVVPAVIRMAIDGGAEAGLPFQSDSIPPQIPIISAPPPAVPSTELEVTGYGEAKSTIKLVHNQAETQEVVAGEDGSFSLTIALQEGENTLTFYAIDEAENESALSREYRVLADSTAPELTIDSPQPDQTFETASNQTISVSGTTDSDTKVYLNGRLLFTDQEGAFSGSQRLNDGDNTLEFRAVDAAGNETTQNLTVTFRY